MRSHLPFVILPFGHVEFGNSAQVLRFDALRCLQTESPRHTRASAVFGDYMPCSSSHGLIC